MVTSRHRSPDGRERITLDEAEAGLVEQYPDLVRLAYLTLPPTLSRHRKVLAAHGLVQRALPGFRQRRAVPRVPAQRLGTERHGSAWVRERVLRAALAYERRPRWWPASLPPPRALRPMLPLVWGLRLFPRAGGREEIALGQALSGLSADVRAAFVLCRADGLPETQVRALLCASGARRPDRALRIARQLDAPAVAAAQTLLRSAEFNACAVQTRPTDLLRRRHRFRLAWAVAAVVAVGAVVLAATGAPTGQRPSRAAVGTTPVAPEDLVRAPREEWADTARVDFTAWPPRGGRTDDRDLLTRALTTWTHPARGTHITRTPGTFTGPPPPGTQLLYAGEADGSTVVIFHDGLRTIRYAEPLSPGGHITLTFTRTDSSDMTTAAALVVTRPHGAARYLTAPWIAEARTRDLLRPDGPARRLRVSTEGVTEPVPSPASAGACGSWPTLQLRTSARIAEKTTFLVTDLGGLTPAHLTHTPQPGGDTPTWQPREPITEAALQNWSRTACHLSDLPDGVRTVNLWNFAEQPLPEDGGRAVWSCVRADTWRGPGEVSVLFTAPGEAGRVVARESATGACSRYGREVVASARWRARSGHGYLVAAGSRGVVGIEVVGMAGASEEGRLLAVRAPGGARAQVRGRLAGGGELAEVGHSTED
ncbi:hypothetical protein ADK70_33865 [Streptomyces rimosus subsp. pseudoverticillatus]|uniref:hypothetical protein n=1 Tax=Streptomyces rimosus TaxID=1927 RepID=UPI0006B271F5|nr:hypothetical protein [Streptomyces rimosus]KOT78542.1 hypothetical protein ADK70_33865 [Streptomyces rimosus subsp. pseudoverticillatus]